MKKINLDRKNIKIGIVTVLYNSGTVLDDFFKSLAIQTYKNFVLYVIDNNSPDDSLIKAKELASKCEFETIFFPEKNNWGVAKGNNIGIKQAIIDGCSHVLLSNNDIVLESTTIELLLNGLLTSNVTMAVPKIYFYGTDLIWAAGGKFKLLWGRTLHIGYKTKDIGQFDNVYQINYSPTCFMLIDISVFDKVGLMDELYFVYWDDTDFIWRATQKNKEKLFYIPDSKLWHKESTCTKGAKSDFSIRYFYRNLIYMLYKHIPAWKRWRIIGYIKLKLQVLLFIKKLSKMQYRLALESLSEGKKLYEKSLNEY